MILLDLLPRSLRFHGIFYSNFLYQRILLDLLPRSLRFQWILLDFLLKLLGFQMTR